MWLAAGFAGGCNRARRNSGNGGNGGNSGNGKIDSYYCFEHAQNDCTWFIYLE